MIWIQQEDGWLDSRASVGSNNLEYWYESVILLHYCDTFIIPRMADEDAEYGKETEGSFASSKRIG